VPGKGGERQVREGRGEETETAVRGHVTSGGVQSQLKGGEPGGVQEVSLILCTGGKGEAGGRLSGWSSG